MLTIETQVTDCCQPSPAGLGVDTTNRLHLCHTLKVRKNFYNRDLLSRMNVFQAPTRHAVHIIESLRSDFVTANIFFLASINTTPRSLSINTIHKCKMVGFRLWIYSKISTTFPDGWLNIICMNWTRCKIDNTLHRPLSISLLRRFYIPKLSDILSGNYRWIIIFKRVY